MTGKRARASLAKAGDEHASSPPGRPERIGQKRSRCSSRRPGKRRKSPSGTGFDTPCNPNTAIPDWKDPRITFECWTDIFLYAAGEGSRDMLSNSWLIQAATTCRAFTEPALTAIYRCPVIKTTAKAKRLALLLERPPSETLYNYRAKVDALQVNVHIVPQQSLYPIIHPLTRLKELIIYTPLDQPPYRDLDKTLRWHYPEDIFRALASSHGDAAHAAHASSKPLPTVLKSWEWSGRFVGGFVADIGAMARLHQTAPFAHLTRLSLTNFQVPSLKILRIKSEEEELESYHQDGVVIQSLAQAISHLSELKHLVFESSTVMNDRLFPLLPKGLTHLELINCWEVKSDDLAAFLRTHGSDLRALTLMHNQSLDLGFLTDLADTCPNLRELHMNLSYYRHHDCVNDADPMYEQALLPSQTPDWPSSLRVLDIEHIRDWSVETAEMFLQSIIDSAPNLPNLRHVAIKTMLDIPWQARATMRHKWRTRMERVFLRPFVPPHRLAATRAPPNDEPTPPSGNDPDESATASSRRGGRIASSNSQVHASHGQPGRSTRPRRGTKLSYKEPDTDEDEFDLEEEEEEEADKSSQSSLAHARDDDDHNPSFIQGKCSTVYILFDNQKVREVQYSMEDFGSEASDSEEEWDGDDQDDDMAVVF
ncbi:hypothetical protein UVI_02007370 [Ustilaginoidea virens]|nr:hypothetical protein UVI_02007370 [Ustilaginoidea virens]